MFDEPFGRGLRSVSQQIASRGVESFKEMEKKLVEKHNLESIRRTMQMQEETFKNQVRELHRVYSVQRMLMSDQGLSTGSCSGDNMKHKHKQVEEDMSSARNKGVDDESDVELTLSIGSGNNRSTHEKEARELHSSASFKADRGGGGDCTHPIPTSTKRPHWLFQGLTLNSGS